MSVSAHFAALAAGRRPAADGLLGTCRLEWAGGEAYGEEAILELFRASPFAPGDEATLVESATAAAWIGRDRALVADLYGGRIGRLWRLGNGVPPATEPNVAVAFDPDLAQARGDVLFRRADHPALDSDRTEAVIATGHALVTASAPQPLHRARVFVIRAFSGAGGTAALYAVHRLTGGAVRGGGFGHAAALLGDGTEMLVADHAPAQPWTPRL